MSKYELTDETRQVAGHTLHRIRAVRDIGTYVNKGDIGGWIESEKNLSQDGDCWVSGEACVYGNARVYGNAVVNGCAVVCGNAHVGDDAWVFGSAKVYGSACVYGDARAFDFASVCGSARVFDYARVYGSAEVWVGAVWGRAEICGDARIGGTADYTVIRNSWSSGSWITYTRSNRMWNVGCFYGTGEQLIEKAYEDDELKGKCYEATVRYMEQIEVFMAGEKKEKDNG